MSFQPSTARERTHRAAKGLRTGLGRATSHSCETVTPPAGRPRLHETAALQDRRHA